MTPLRQSDCSDEGDGALWVEAHCGIAFGSFLKFGSSFCIAAIAPSFPEAERTDTPRASVRGPAAPSRFCGPGMKLPLLFFRRPAPFADSPTRSIMDESAKVPVTRGRPGNRSHPQLCKCWPARASRGLRAQMRGCKVRSISELLSRFGANRISRMSSLCQVILLITLSKKIQAVNKTRMRFR